MQSTPSQSFGQRSWGTQQEDEGDFTFALAMLGLGLLLTLLGFGIGSEAGSVGLLVVGTVGVIMILIGIIAAIIEAV